MFRCLNTKSLKTEGVWVMLRLFICRKRGLIYKKPPFFVASGQRVIILARLSLSWKDENGEVCAKSTMSR